MWVDTRDYLISKNTDMRWIQKGNWYSRIQGWGGYRRVIDIQGYRDLGGYRREIDIQGYIDEMDTGE